MAAAAVDRARSKHAAVEAAGHHACQLGWRFFLFPLDPRIHGSSKIRTDPRRFRVDPGFGGFVLPPEQSLRAKTYLAMESVNSLRISAPPVPWWPLRQGRDGKCERRNEKCEFLARESVSSSPILARQWWRHFRLSLFLSLYYRKRGSASYIVRQWLLWEGEREREREREGDACDVIRYHAEIASDHAYDYLDGASTQRVDAFWSCRVLECM